MIKAQIYDVFCDELAQGNPCGVVELNHWLSDSELLQITHQSLNLSHHLWFSLAVTTTFVGLL